MPLSVPKIRGVRLSFASKSSVPPVDCHTYSGRAYPSYQTLPKSVRRLISGWGFLSFQSAIRPSPPSAITPSALGAIATAPSAAGARSESSVWPEVP